MFRHIERCFRSRVTLQMILLPCLFFFHLQLNKPLLVEGPAGVGKTEIAKVMAKALQTDLIRLAML